MFVEIAVCVISLSFSVFLFALSRQFHPSTYPGMPGPAFFPVIIAVAIFALSFAQLVITVISRRKTGGETAQTERKRTRPERMKILRVAVIILLILLYALLWIYRIGHFLPNSVAVFIPITMLYGGARERRWWQTSLFVVVLVIFTYVLFKYLLKVDL